MKNKILYVGGTYNDQGGKPSKIAKTIFNYLDLPAEYHNGGKFSELESLISSIESYNPVFWFPNVPNDKPKHVNQIKKTHSRCLLVTSKRNIEDKYAFPDVIYHGLKNKSNLIVELTKDNQLYVGTVLDPLGNVYVSSSDFRQVGHTLGKRVKQMISHTRVGSQSIGKSQKIPDEKEFFELIRQFGKQFHLLVHSSFKATNRFFGNASFRCTLGFPSFRNEDRIYVSRRNIDKRLIGREGFVAVLPEIPVKYFGTHAPSVDTPIQIRLYQHYKTAKYMLHGHVYVNNAPFSEKILPCGTLEEADEVKKQFPDSDQINFAFNMAGHGFVAVADNLDFLANMSFRPRNTPESHAYEAWWSK